MVKQDDSFGHRMQKGDQWLQELIEGANFLSCNPEEKELIETLLDEIYGNAFSNISTNMLLAAAFDLLVAAAYYSHVAHVGWVYCPHPADTPLQFYPYTNTCPRCALDKMFKFHKANKPKSGEIGKYTSKLLLIFLQELFKRKGLNIEVRKGREPVDAVFIDRTTTPQTVMFAEIKAAPLVTLPLVVPSQPLVLETVEGAQPSGHKMTDFTYLYGTQLDIFLPVYNAKRQTWVGERFSLGIKKDQRDAGWAFRGMRNLLMNDQTFLKRYFDFWVSVFHDYGQRNKSGIYWLTNACGQPSPRPADWPRKGRGYESISDSKTSAGMDRTDDLKKATYQVLKLGVEGKPSRQFAYKVGIVSNIHAVRHFEEYLDAFTDIIWTRDETGKVSRAKDLPPDTELFNLFDGIVSLTETLARDEWVKKTFSF